MLCGFTMALLKRTEQRKAFNASSVFAMVLTCQRNGYVKTQPVSLPTSALLHCPAFQSRHRRLSVHARMHWHGVTDAECGFVKIVQEQQVNARMITWTLLPRPRLVFYPSVTFKVRSLSHAYMHTIAICTTSTQSHTHARTHTHAHTHH